MQPGVAFVWGLAIGLPATQSRLCRGGRSPQRCCAPNTIPRWANKRYLDTTFLNMINEWVDILIFLECHYLTLAWQTLTATSCQNDHEHTFSSVKLMFEWIVMSIKPLRQESCCTNSHKLRLIHKNNGLPHGFYGLSIFCANQSQDCC